MVAPILVWCYWFDDNAVHKRMQTLKSPVNPFLSALQPFFSFFFPLQNSVPFWKFWIYYLILLLFPDKCWLLCTDAYLWFYFHRMSPCQSIKEAGLWSRQAFFDPRKILSSGMMSCLPFTKPTHTHTTTTTLPHTPYTHPLNATTLFTFTFYTIISAEPGSLVIEALTEDLCHTWRHFSCLACWSLHPRDQAPFAGITSHGSANLEELLLLLLLLLLLNFPLYIYNNHIDVSLAPVWSL